jgi:hypothetical protein
VGIHSPRCIQRNVVYALFHSMSFRIFRDRLINS